MGISLPPNGGPPQPPNGMRRLVSALDFYERKQEVNANNVANVTTDGFKGERVFSRLVNGAIPAVESATDLRPGALRKTERPTDLAIDGPGFFVVSTARGERLSRGGAFRLDDQGRLVTSSGDVLLGEHGPIVVPSGATPSVSPDGTVHVGTTVLDRLRMEAVTDGTTLRHEAGTTFSVNVPTTALALDARRVQQGAVEEGNVNSVDAMVELISTARGFSDVQKVMTVIDQVHGIIATDLGKPGQ